MLVGIKNDGRIKYKFIMKITQFSNFMNSLDNYLLKTLKKASVKLGYPFQTMKLFRV